MDKWATKKVSELRANIDMTLIVLEENMHQVMREINETYKTT
jgi:hypothetical protein